MKRKECSLASSSLTAASSSPKRRKSRVKSFIEYPGGDWIISAELAANILVDVLSLLYTTKSMLIMLPGVGLSSLPIALYQAGYHQLTLLDLEEKSIDKQRNNFISNLGSLPSSVNLIQCDVLVDGFRGVAAKSQDIIIDKGFMDVFLRQSSSQQVWKDLQATLKDTGMMLIMSIFHQKWKRLLSAKMFPSVLYSSIEVKRYSSTRPTVSSFSYPGAFFVVQRQPSEEALTISAAEASPLLNFRDMKASEFPLDASQL
jgi:hypothetical protein